jgi:prepilin peptidase CpaA
MLGAAMSAFAGTSAKVEAPARPTADLPYAIAIASGTTLYLIVTRATGWTVESLLR